MDSAPGGSIRRHRRRAGLVLAATGHGRAGSGRDAEGDAVEPAPDRFPVADGGGAADEDQEGGLEGVLGVVLVAEDRTADAEDHRPVTLEQGGERRLRGLVAAVGEPAQELGVGQAPMVPESKSVWTSWRTAPYRFLTTVPVSPTAVFRPVVSRRRPTVPIFWPSRILGWIRGGSARFIPAHRGDGGVLGRPCRHRVGWLSSRTRRRPYHVEPEPAFGRPLQPEQAKAIRGDGREILGGVKVDPDAGGKRALRVEDPSGQGPDLVLAGALPSPAFTRTRTGHSTTSMGLPGRTGFRIGVVLETDGFGVPVGGDGQGLLVGRDRHVAGPGGTKDSNRP